MSLIRQLEAQIRGPEQVVGEARYRERVGLPPLSEEHEVAGRVAVQVAVMTREIAFTAVYEPVEHGWVQARVKELPEVITVGPTIEEAQELLLDALIEYLRSLGDAEGAPAAPEPLAERPLAISLSA